MKAVVITCPGGPEVLEVRDRPDPPFGPKEVRIRVRATAMNRADLLQRRGVYPAPAGSPADVSGLEFAGEVEACGARARGVRVGDRVMGIAGGGAHAEKIVVDAGLCIPVPEALSWEQAAAVPEAFLTAHDALSQARLAAGPSEDLASRPIWRRSSRRPCASQPSFLVRSFPAASAATPVVGSAPSASRGNARPCKATSLRRAACPAG